MTRLFGLDFPGWISTLSDVTASSFNVRRAVVDDRDALVTLWETMRLPAPILEKRLTEFQVVVAGDGSIVGAIGIRLAGKHGQIHDEAFLDFAQADELRLLLWERLQSVANNHGLVRLWTQETAPFWSQNEFTKATADELEKLPADWQTDAAGWMTLKLREDLDEVVNLDKEFALFMESEKQHSQQMMDQAKVLKVLATILAVALLLGVIVGGIWVFTKNPGMLQRQ